jgi:UDPglucose 6-dehydrogenase
VAQEEFQRKTEELPLKVGFVGLGKLGLPCAAAVSVKTQSKVVGFDLNSDVEKYIKQAKVPYLEKDCEEYLKKGQVQYVDSIDAVTDYSDIIFVAVQTPHDPSFEGITPVTGDLADFDYQFLVKAIEEIASSLARNGDKSLTLVVISTVLPGTMRKFVLPLLEPLGERVKFCYNPFFIAMGQTIPDFLNPEFVLIGSDDKNAASELANFYGKIHGKSSRVMGIESAELTKVAYNTFIGFKIVFANTLREITMERGGNVDEVTDSLTLATDRLMSGKYLSAGMGDGGGCHPRDQIAMSWMAKASNLSVDIFGFLARARDAQSYRQATQIYDLSKSYGLPIVILGAAYKPDINITVGSPAILLANQLREMGASFEVIDPLVFPEVEFELRKALYFVATNHSIFRDFVFSEGSVIIDPWRNSIDEDPAYTTVRPGRGL